MTADKVTLRIDDLVRNYLQKIATDESGWETLYQDPSDGRYWELTYPSGESHGGGPPRLTVVSSQEAALKYKIR